MSRHPSLLLCASRDELARTVGRLEAGRRWRRGALCGREGRLEGREVVVAWSGEGPQRARSALCEVADLSFDEPILALGVAGALHPGAAIGELVVGDRVLYGDRVFEAPRPWLAAALRFSSLEAGALVTVDRIVDTDEQRVELWSRLGEPSRGCVDMESAAWIEAATEQGRALLVVRAVSDRRGDRLPAFLGRCRRADGSIDRTQVAFKALWRPWAIPGLARLARRVSTCSTRLDGFARWWLRQREVPR